MKISKQKKEEILEQLRKIPVIELCCSKKCNNTTNSLSLDE